MMQQREDERAESYRQGLRQGSVLRAAFLLSGFPPRLYFHFYNRGTVGG